MFYEKRADQNNSKITYSQELNTTNGFQCLLQVKMD